MLFFLFIFCLLLFVLVPTLLFNFPKFLCYLRIVLFWSIGSYICDYIVVVIVVVVAVFVIVVVVVPELTEPV